MTHSATSAPRPVALIILDGYGHNPDAEHNAVLAARTPVMDRLWQSHPHSLIHTDGRHVGLPDGQMGNSEVGHMNLGAGRIVYQDFTRITKAIEDGDLDTIEALTRPIDAAVAAGKGVHLLGLLSPGGVHSHRITCWPWPSWPLAAVPSVSMYTPSWMDATCRPGAP